MSLRDEAAKLSQLGKAYHQRQQEDQSTKGQPKNAPSLRDEAAKLSQLGKAYHQQEMDESSKVKPSNTSSLRDEAAKLSQLGKAYHQQQMDESAKAKPNKTPSLRDEAAAMVASSAASKTSPDQQQITTTGTESKAEEAARLIRAGRTFHEQEQASLHPNRDRGSSLRNEAAELIKKGIAERSSQDKGEVRIRNESKAEEAARLIRAGRTFHEQDDQERRQEVCQNYSPPVGSCCHNLNLKLLYTLRNADLYYMSNLIN